VQTRKLLFALVILGILATWTWQGDSGQEVGISAPASHPFFPELQGTDIASFQLGNPGKTISLLRQSFSGPEAETLRHIGLGESGPEARAYSTWMVEGVPPRFADFDLAETAAEALAEMAWESAFPAPPDLSPYGLRTEPTAASFRTSAGTSHSFLLGSETPLGGRRYVTLEGSGIISLVDSWALRSLERDPQRLLEQRVFPFDPARIVGLKIQRRGAPSLKLTRGRRSWVIDDAEGLRAEQDWVRELLRGLSALQAVSFNPPGQTQEPTLSVHLVDQDGREGLLEITPQEGGRTYSAFPAGALLPAAFNQRGALIEAKSVDPLLAEVQDIRALQLLDFNVGAVVLVEWQSKGSLWTFRRSNGGWSLQPGESAAPSALPDPDVAAFLTSLSELRADAYSAGHQTTPSAGSPSASLVIHQSNGHRVGLRLFDGGLGDRVAIDDEPGLRDVSSEVSSLLRQHRKPGAAD
jgi:hypothetical protein